MAEIDLERKPGRRGWVPWVLAGLVAVLAIWAVAEIVDREEPVAADLEPAEEVVVPAPAAEVGPVDEEAAPAAPAVAELRQTCVNQQPPEPEVGLQHEYTVTCLESLAAAMDATIRADTAGRIALEERLTTLRERAEEVRQADPSQLSHAGTTAEALEAGAELLETLQERAGDGELEAEVQQVRQAADAIDPDQPLLEQDDQLRRYFEQMAAALEQLNGPGGTTGTP